MTKNARSSTKAQLDALACGESLRVVIASLLEEKLSPVVNSSSDEAKQSVVDNLSEFVEVVLLQAMTLKKLISGQHILLLIASELLVIVELPKAPPPLVGEESLPPTLEAEITLVLTLADLSIDFSMGRFLFV